MAHIGTAVSANWKRQVIGEANQRQTKEAGEQ